MKDVIEFVHKVGQAHNILAEILDNELFIDLSKHNAFWHSTSDSDSSKLSVLRTNLSRMSDQLWQIQSLIKTPETEDDD